jgi:hypothetical protein
MSYQKKEGYYFFSELLAFLGNNRMVPFVPPKRERFSKYSMEQSPI